MITGDMEQYLGSSLVGVPLKPVAGYLVEGLMSSLVREKVVVGQYSCYSFCCKLNYIY